MLGQLGLIIFAFIHFGGAQNVPNACFCVPTGTCNNNNNPGGGGTDGAGNIDIRIVNVSFVSFRKLSLIAFHPQTPGAASGQTGTSLQITTAVSSGITTIVNSPTFCQNLLERCCPSAGWRCGTRYPAVSGALNPSTGQAAFGSYPWQAVLLAPGDIYQGSGVLIDHFHVLTAAHRVNEFL